jgi:4-hydroxybenzoyl-CoA reductase beta subunit
VGEALLLLAQHGDDCRVLAGGTDLLVRMKQRLITPARLMSLKNLSDLIYVRQQDNRIAMGARTSIAQLLKSNPVQTLLPGFSEALSSIGAPSMQHVRGTIGGNLCQENRCQFFNQSAFFRGARPACHKAGGQVCYAREGGSDRCHSACQSDTAPILMALDATVTLQSKNGKRNLALAEFYTGVGEHPNVIEAHELLTDIDIPLPAPQSGNAYEKLAWRSAVDFPIVSAGAVVTIDGNRITGARLVIGAVASAPLVIATAEKILEGRPIDDLESITRLGEAAGDSASAFMVNNMAPPAAYRKHMVAVIAGRAMKRAIARASV